MLEGRKIMRKVSKKENFLCSTFVLQYGNLSMVRYTYYVFTSLHLSCSLFCYHRVSLSLADEIYTKLMSEYNIKIDDRSNEWHCIDLNNPYARRAGDTSAHISDEDVVYIDNKLKERFGLKREKQYEDADAIRNELKERFNVKIDDRTKEWFVDS